MLDASRAYWMGSKFLERKGPVACHKDAYLKIFLSDRNKTKAERK
jgi:hypothetical protein